MRSVLLLLCSLLCLSVVLFPHSALAESSYYDLLEVPPSASDKEIKKAYRRLALLHHPDKATSSEESKQKEELFINLANAYEVLTNEILRPRYDYLLTQKIYVYEDRIRDWSTFDPQTGTFNAAAHTVVLGDGRFTFRTRRSYHDAAALYAQQQAEAQAETQALILALIGSFIIALTPVTYYYYQRLQSSWKEKKKKAEASLRLKDTQGILKEIQEEQQLQRELQREAEKEVARRKREEREAAEADAQAAADIAENEEDDNEDHDGTNKQLSHDTVDNNHAAPIATNAKDNSTTDVSDAGSIPSDGPTDKPMDDDEPPSPIRVRDASSIYHCELCRKKFKSMPQLENHFNSNQHKKAAKEAGVNNSSSNTDNSAKAKKRAKT